MTYTVWDATLETILNSSGDISGCDYHCRRGCGMAEIWDLEDTDNRHRQPVCELLAYQPEPYFRRVFRNHQYDILQVVSSPPSDQ